MALRILTDKAPITAQPEVAPFLAREGVAHHPLGARALDKRPRPTIFARANFPKRFLQQMEHCEETRKGEESQEIQRESSQ